MLNQFFRAYEASPVITLVVCGVVALLWLVEAIAKWRIFNKMGEAGWKAFIPIYGEFIVYKRCWSLAVAWRFICIGVLYMISDATAYYLENVNVLVFTLVSLVALVFAVYDLYLSIRVNLQMAKSFGRGAGFGLGLWLLPYIFTFILGYGEAEYMGPAPIRVGKETKK